MKTAISIPDPIFTAAEDLAAQLGISRSELYTKALSKLIAEQKAHQITQALNDIYSQEESSLDPVMAQMQALSLQTEEW